MSLPRLVASLGSIFLWAASATFAQEADKLSIAIIPKGMKEASWPSIHAGALKAKEDLARGGYEVEILWKANLQERPRSEQIQIVDTFTGQRLSGIVVASLDDEKISNPVYFDSALNLPRIVIDSAFDASSPVSYVTTDNFQAGSLAADRIGQLIEEEGNVILLRYESGDTSGEAREAGFIERIKNRYPSVRLISIDQHSGSDYRRAYSICEYLLNRYGDRVNAVFASHENGVAAMLQALRTYNYAKQVYLVGCDANPKSLEAIKAGDIHGLVVSNPFRIGYVGIINLVDYVQGRNTPTVVDTGVRLVTQANIESEEIDAILNPPIDEYLK